MRDGLREIGDGLHAYLQGDGGWCLSNAGVVVSGGRTLLIDTLVDLPRTRLLLEAVGRVNGGRGVDTLVNTHANLDHTFGNQLVGAARIVASNRTREEMLTGIQPEAVRALVAQGPGGGRLGEFLVRVFGRFDFEGITLTPPTDTFDGEHVLRVGEVLVRLIELGPAHTQGDTILHLPAQGVVFAGDILFNGGHPVIWAGPHTNWIAALNRILALEPVLVVPGHGAVAGPGEVRRLKGYFEHLAREARERWAAGMAVEEAVRDIPLADYRGWGEPERVIANVGALYREFAGEPPAAPAAVLAAMALYDG